MLSLLSVSINLLSLKTVIHNLSFSQAAKIFLVSLLVTGSVVAIRQSGGFQSLELFFYDQMVRLHPTPPLDSRLLMVGITDEDIQQLKRWPISDQTLADLLKTLQQYQPKVIGVDLLRDIPHPPGQAALWQELQADNVIAIEEKVSNVRAPAGVPPNRVGFNDFVIDADNVLRRNLLYVDLDGQPHYSLGLRVSLHYLRDRPLSVQALPDGLKIDNILLPSLLATSGGYQMPVSEAKGWQIMLQYRSRQANRVVRTLSLQQVLDREFEPQWIEGKVVLIGTVAPSAKDLFLTPYSAGETKAFRLPGVVIHAQMVSQLLSIMLDEERQFWFWRQWQEWLWIWFWSLMGGILVWRFNRLVPLGGAIAIALIALWGACFWLFSLLGWIPWVPPALALLVSGAFLLAYKAIYRTYHDPLTGLPNRRLFLQQLKRANDGTTPFHHPWVAVLFLDLDRFKTINDGLGNQAGDYLLIAIAQRLQKRVTFSLQLGRVGGDEFALWLKSSAGTEEANNLADRIGHDLSEPFYWQGKEIFITVSIGIAFERTGKAFREQELLRYADIAMYRAKELGKARHEMFVAGMDTEAVQRWQLETDLRAALKHEEFQLYYQPIVSLRTQKIAGFEALVRWNSPSRGFVSPGDFIPLAEETGLIVPLGQWILRQACRQIRTWQERYPQISPLIMSINLSSRQFTQPDLVKQIRAILDEEKITGDRVKLEITESMMMNDVETAITLLKRLKSLGLRLSIDDFGTGYSSLSYLHRFPIDTLKVDKSFVSRMEEGEDSDKYTQIVRTIITLGHNLDLDVIAEGVETAAQVKVLESLNCEYGQGYYFSRPLASEDAERLLTENQAWAD